MLQIHVERIPVGELLEFARNAQKDQEGYDWFLHGAIRGIDT